MKGRLRLAGVAAALLLAATPALAQRGLIRQGYLEYPAAPDALSGPALTTDAIIAARGNVVRWRDGERARIGPYLKENELANARMRNAYLEALNVRPRTRGRDRDAVPAPTYLPLGPTLPVFGGYFAYFYDVDGAPKMTVMAASWRDQKSNTGEASSVHGLPMLPDTFCSVRDVSLADIAYLGPAYTPEIAALNVAWLGPRQDALTLTGAELKFTRTPAGAMFYRYYPQRALEREMEGTVSMLCGIGAAATLACAITSEEPAGWGFGAAALKIAAEGYVVDPVLPAGGPSVGRKVCLSTLFRLED